MRKLIKDQNGNVFELASPKGFIPDGYTEVPAEELDNAEAAISAQKLGASRDAKLNEVRAAREPKLKRADILTNIAYLDAWDDTKKAALKDFRQALLDITNPYKADASLLDSLDVSAVQWPTEPT
jgi:hypothetical protein